MCPSGDLFEAVVPLHDHCGVAADLAGVAPDGSVAAGVVDVGDAGTWRDLGLLCGWHAQSIYGCVRRYKSLYWRHG